jgi:hypothetical protein
MGYFASLAPNPALAKEAFALRLDQGKCYFDNFFGLYQTVWPLVSAGVFLAAVAGAHAAARRWLAVATTLVPALAGIASLAYVVAMGGD